MNSKKIHRAEYYRKLLLKKKIKKENFCYVKDQLRGFNTFCFVSWPFARFYLISKTQKAQLKKKRTQENMHIHI